MPILPFESLPDVSRVWVFGCDRPLDDNEAARLLAEVDRFLTHWHAHGHPLAAARDWSYDRFLTIAVDQSVAGASGCSIDGLYRALRPLEQAFGVGMLGGGGLFYRDANGDVRHVSREDFCAAAQRGEIGRDTVCFDVTVESLGEWRERFEAPAHAGWQATLLPRVRAGA
jgi:hypothetical protein